MTASLRPATGEDAELLLEWRNDPATRAASFTEEEISLEDHRAWLERRLADDDCLLLVIEDRGEAAGSVRVERESPELAEIHVVVAPEARGRGLAGPALTAGSEAAGRELGVSRILARVKEGNTASLRAFEAAGFQESARSEGVVELLRPAGGTPTA